MQHDEIVRQIHDASIALGAECGKDCWFGRDQEPDSYDGKMVTIDRAKALAFLAELTN